MAKGRRVKKESEFDNDAVKTSALDREYKDVLSTSPLKHRVKFDLYGSPNPKEENKSESRKMKNSASHSAMKES